MVAAMVVAAVAIVVAAVVVVVAAVVVTTVVVGDDSGGAVIVVILAVVIVVAAMGGSGGLECGHHGLERIKDEKKGCGYFCWIDPPLLNKWYKERMYELGDDANGGVAIPFNNHVNEVEKVVDGHISLVNVDVPIV
uniref:Uncharacterized protein n=1 Tax=Lactuca sativa TaxID=4236 RepID=A0A9R1UPG7_LACSA|nr:hypothetical protein LSAT_V11C800426520 [Lactuca sativa]